MTLREAIMALLNFRKRETVENGTTPEMEAFLKG